MEGAVTSQASLFWRKLGWWQVLTIIVVLITFFIALHLTSQKELAGVIAAIVVAIIMLVNAGYTAFTNSPAPFMSTTTLVIGAFTVMIVQVAILLVFPVGLAIIMLNYEAGKHGIKKRTVWFSCLMEFIIILVPILLA